MPTEVARHRRFLHQIPETGTDLPQTRTLISGVLRGSRCPCFSPAPGTICAWFDFGCDETTAFRFVLDAQPIQETGAALYASRSPGVMHAAGHDGEAAMGLELCRWLLPRPEGIRRNVLAIFQPAGDAPGGADALCRAGFLEQYRVRRIFSLRLWPGLAQGQLFTRPGPMTPQSSQITVQIRGKSASLSRRKEGHDALLAGAALIRRVYHHFSFIEQEGTEQGRTEQEGTEQEGAAVLLFGKMTSGTAAETVSEEARLEGVLHTYSRESFRRCRDGLLTAVRKTEEESKCQIEVQLWSGNTIVWNDDQLYDAVCAQIPVRKLRMPVSAPDDFGFYQQRVPGILFLLGLGDTPDAGSSDFDFDDEAVLPAGLEVLRRLALLP